MTPIRRRQGRSCINCCIPRLDAAGRQSAEQTSSKKSSRCPAPHAQLVEAAARYPAQSLVSTISIDRATPARSVLHTTSTGKVAVADERLAAEHVVVAAALRTGADRLEVGPGRGSVIAMARRTRRAPGGRYARFCASVPVQQVVGVIACTEVHAGEPARRP